MTFPIKRLLVIALTSALMGGCAPSSYQVKTPAPSNAGYEKTATNDFSPLQLVDMRSDKKTFSYGILPAELKLNKAPLAPVDFLQEHTDKELAARGIDRKSVV